MDHISEMQVGKSMKIMYCPYHPMQMFESYIFNMLGTLPLNKKSSWRAMVSMLVHAYNCTRGTAMGLSPCYLMSG